MKRLTLAILVALAFVAGLSALPLTVSWAEGRVDLQRGSSWVAVNIGDRIDSASTLRLGADASVELSGAQQRISLTASGTYAIDSIIRKSQDASKAKAGMLGKMGKLVDPNAPAGQTAIAGVRGAAVEPTEDSFTWLSDSVDVEALMDEGRALLREGDYAGAAAVFSEAAAASDGDQLDAASYAAAWALASDGSLARSVKILRSMPSSGPWAGPRALLLARLDLDSAAPSEAKAILVSAKAAGLFVGDDVELAEALLAEASSR